MTTVDEIVVKCCFNDAIKRRGTYFVIGEELTNGFVEEAVRQGYHISDGYCPPCYQRELEYLKRVRR